jgi:hypothetical protein
MDDNRPNQARLIELFDYDSLTGHFHWRGGRSGVTPGMIAGNMNGDKYIQITIDQRPYMAHRLAWVYVEGVWPSGQIDHINGIRWDNRYSNLRDVPEVVNHQNRQAKANNYSGLLGVSWYANRQKWGASIKPPGAKRKHLGLFPTKEEAHAAYLAAKRVMHEGCTI